MDSEKKYQHLILDASAFIHNGPITNLGHSIYTCREIIDEIKDKATRDRIRNLPFEIKLLQYDNEDLEKCIEFSKVTGDYRQLSAADLKLISLTYSLEKRVNGTKYLKEVQKTKTSTPEDEAEEDEEEEQDDEGHWITPDNIHEMYKNAKTDPNRVTVACMTSDFSIQNCMLQMGLLVVSPVDGMIIHEARKIILRCHACLKVYYDPEKVKNDFCPHCGNLDTLKRVQYVVENGVPRVIINFKRPIKVKGTNQQLPRPRGGKHANNPILAPDQKVRKDKVDKFTAQEKKNLTADHILSDPAYLVRTNPFAHRNQRPGRK